MKELQYLLHAFLLGIGICFLYDCFRILRRVFRHNSFFVAVEDLIFWAICCVKVWKLMLTDGEGVLRWFAVLGAFVGMFLYEWKISRRFVGFTSQFLRALVRAVCCCLCKMKNKLTAYPKMHKINLKR